MLQNKTTKLFYLFYLSYSFSGDHLARRSSKHFHKLCDQPLARALKFPCLRCITVSPKQYMASSPYSLYFLQNAATDYDKIVTLLSRLGGRALQWAMAVWEKQGNKRQSYERFVSAMRLVFDDRAVGQQGRRTAADYTLEFRIIAVESNWTLVSLCRGLNSTLQKALVGCDNDLYWTS